VSSTTDGSRRPLVARLDDARFGVGVTLWLASETMFFAGLFGAYFTLRSVAPAWPPPDVTLDPLRSGIATLVLIASSGFVIMAERRPHQAVRWVWGAVALGAVFLANQVLEYGSLGFSIDTHPYGSIYFLLTGFHGLHVLGGLILLSLAAVGLRGRADTSSQRLTRGAVMYWHFVDVVWIFLFLVVFVVQ